MKTYPKFSTPFCCSLHFAVNVLQLQYYDSRFIPICQIEKTLCREDTHILWMHAIILFTDYTGNFPKILCCMVRGLQFNLRLKVNYHIQTQSLGIYMYNFMNNKSAIHILLLWTQLNNIYISSTRLQEKLTDFSQL